MIALDSNITKSETGTTNTTLQPLNSTIEEASNQQNNSIPSPSLETTEKVVPVKTETQTESPVTNKVPHSFEPRPFSLVSRKESSTTVQTETTTPTAKVSEHTSSSGGLRQNGFYDDVNSLNVNSKTTLQRERSRFVNNKNSVRSEEVEEHQPRIRNPNRVRFTPPTSTPSYTETEEERLKKIRTFRPNVELEIADLSSLTAVDFSATSRDEKRRRGRPRTSTTTPLPPTPSTTVPSRTRFRFRQNDKKKENETEQHGKTLQKVTSEQPQEKVTLKPFRRNRKIIRRVRPSSTAAPSTTSTTTTTERSFSKEDEEDTTDENIQANTVIEEANNAVATTVIPVVEDNETENNQEREDILKSPEEGENIKLSESVRQESSVNNGIGAGDGKRPRKVIKLNRYTPSTTESGIIVRTRKIIRKLHPTKSPVVHDEEIKKVESNLESSITSENSTDVEESKPQRPSFFSRKRPPYSSNSQELSEKQNQSKDVKIVPFTSRRRFGTKYGTSENKNNLDVSKPQFRQRSTSTTTTTTTTTTTSSLPIEEDSSDSDIFVTTTEFLDLRQEVGSSTTSETFATVSVPQEQTTSVQDETTEFIEQTTSIKEVFPVQGTTSTTEAVLNVTEGLDATTIYEKVYETTTAALEDEETTTVPLDVTSIENEIATTEDATETTISTEAVKVSTENVNEPVFNNPLYKPPGSRTSFSVPKSLFNSTRAVEVDKPERNSTRGFLGRKFQRRPPFTSTKSTTEAAIKPRKGFRYKHTENVDEEEPESTIELNNPESSTEETVDEEEEIAVKPSTEGYKSTTPVRKVNKPHYERKGYRYKHVKEQSKIESELENETHAPSEDYADVEEEIDTTVRNHNRYGETNSEKAVPLTPTENTSLYHNSGNNRYKSNQTTTLRTKPSRNFGFRQRSTTVSSVQDIKDVNIHAINLRNKNLFNKNRKMNIPHPGNHKQNDSKTTTQDEENKISSPVSITTPASLPETTEQQTTLLHVFAVTESLDDEDGKATESPKIASEQSAVDAKNKTQQKLIEINRIVEVHSEEKIITNKTESIESKSLGAVPVVDKLGVITRVVEIKIVQGNQSAAQDDREDRKLNNGGIKINSVQEQEQPNKIEIIDNRSRVKTITPNPLFNDASTISLEGLFSSAMSHKSADEEDELLNTQNSNLFKIRLLDQDRSSSSKKIRFDNTANFIPLTILKQDEEKAEVIELPPQNFEGRIKIAPVSLLKVEMGDASHKTKDER